MYTAVCEETKRALLPTSALGEHPCNSWDSKMHYSFDFAQQIHYPSNPLQPGPIFFKTPRKCGIFGVCCEALSSQVNYLIDESVQAGKGSNCVVSLLHHFLENYGLGIFMQIIAVDKTKTVAWWCTSFGMCSLGGMRWSISLFSLQATQKLWLVLWAGQEEV